MGMLDDKSDEAILQIAAPIMDNLMDGSTERDWRKHTRDFTSHAKAGLTEDNLLQQCAQYQSAFGNFAEREFVGITRHPQYVNILWKQKMSKRSGEYMAVLTLVEQDEGYRVIRCWVDLWEPKGSSEQR